MQRPKNIDAPELLFQRMVTHNDEKDFQKLFHIFYQGLCVYARRYVEDSVVCEDIVQDMFVHLWAERSRIRIEKTVIGYLTASVRNQCLNYLRKEGLFNDYYEAEQNKDISGEENVYQLTELYYLYEKSLASLPEKYRIVFELHRMEGKSYEEIAQIQDISVRTAKRYKAHVTDVLRKDLKDYLPLITMLTGHIIN